MAPEPLGGKRGLIRRAGAIVLTGGLSTRMGTDKASLVVNGAAMVDRVTGVLAEAGVGPRAIAGSIEVPDPEANQGPMAGIVAGWRHLQTANPQVANLGPVDPVVVLSCDLPSITAEVITHLIGVALNHRHGAVAHDGTRPQPLIAAYRPCALDQLEYRYLEGERSVRKCFTEWDLGTVEFDPRVLADADRPEDLKGFDVEWPC